MLRPQRGFSDVQVRDDAAFRGYELYIHNNPVKAGMARTAEEYPHCSLYLRRQKAQGLKHSPMEEVADGPTKVVP